MNPMPIVYAEIPAPDIDKAGSFYGSIFGWTITPSNLTDSKYWMFDSGEGSLMGAFDSSKLPQGGGVILYIKVDDILSTLTEIEALGGEVLRTKFEIGGGYGFSATFKDPNGNSMGLWSKS